MIKELPLASAEDLEAAIALAHEHFLDRKKWLAPHERIAILQRVIEIMKTRIPELTEIAAQELAQILHRLIVCLIDAEHLRELPQQERPAAGR